MFRTPMIHAVHVYPDDEDEEPWDQRRSSSRKPTYEDTATHMDEGELPSLSSRTSTQQLKGGDLEQRKFWGQLDTHSQDEEDDEVSEDESMIRRGDEDMPDDELIMSSSRSSSNNNNKSSNQQQRALRNTPRQSDEHYEAESYEDRALASGFCDSTLTALSDMCGASSYTSTKRRPLSPRVHSDVQEEHTAIEVEFVEEETEPARHRPDVSVESKNAYLSAMAAQAKEDFRNQKKEDADDMQKRSTPNVTPSVDDADAYESFNAAEKRKFIRLINTGANPREATQMILQERSTLKPEPPRKAPQNETTVLPKRSLNDSSSKHRSHRSAVLFWKKSKYNQQNNRSASAEPIRPSVSQDEQDVARIKPSPSLNDKITLDDDEDEIGGRFAKSGIQFYDAERKEDKEEDELMMVSEPPNTPSSVRSTRSEQLRKVGFKSLAERRAKIAPRVTTNSTREEDVQRLRQANDAPARALTEEDDNDSMTDYDNILDTAEDSGSYSKNASFDPEMTLDEMAEYLATMGDTTVIAEAKNDERSTGLYANARKQYEGINVPASDESVYTAQTSDTGYTGVTGVTGVTTYSHSNRVRRPGAAKKRLAKEKELQEKAKGSQGWVQSIKEVAATTSQKWDPFLGWLNYLEPVVELPGKPASQENMHLDLTGKILTPSKRSTMDDAGLVNTAKSAPVPFPQEWEKERERMLKEAAKNGQLAESLTGGQGLSRDGIPQEGSRPNSWIESMKAASAHLAKDGMQWDPVKGWVNRDGTLVAVSTDGDFTASAPLPIPPSSAIPTEQILQTESTDSAGTMERIGAAPIVQPERYVQLGDTGSVRSVHQDLPAYAASTRPSNAQPIPSVYESTYVSDDDTDVDSAPLSNEGDTFRAEEQVVAQTAVNVSVVKEKISNEDMGLFASGNNKNVGHTGRSESLGSEGLPELFASRQQDDPKDWNSDFVDGDNEPRSQEQQLAQAEADMNGVDEIIDKKALELKPTESFGRRGDGPVDLDELEEESEHDAKSTFSTNTDVKYVASGTSSTGRKVSSDAVPLQDLQAADDMKKVDRNIFRDQNAHPAVGRHIRTAASHDSYDQEMADHHQSLSRSFSREEPVRVVSPGIRNTVAEWESRAAKSDVAPPSPTSNSAEWKVFLANKVRAEQDASSGAERLGADGRSLNMPRQLFISSHDDGDGYDDDSLFDFKSAVNAPSGDGVSRNDVRASGKQDTTPTMSRFSDRKTPIKSDSAPLEDISHLSPINSRDEDADLDDVRDIPASKVYGAETAKRVNFFQRLAECTGPVMMQNKGIPSSHLSFLQNNICGRPDDVHEDAASDDDILDKDIEKLDKCVVMDDVANVSISDGKEDADLQQRADRKLDIKLSRSKPGGGFSSRRSSAGSSVISDENFGAKTAYLEAIAMKAAVAKPRSRSRARSTSNSSVVSADSSAHSEKWKAFLERKKAGGATPSVIGKTSEKYTDDRYKEMLAKLKSSPRQVESDELSQSAKDLSGAKVEALMAQLTGSNLAEAEI